ncbi:MAG: ribonuclease P protein component 1 [Candidatus Micrarchaeia archaeon]
MIKRTNIIAHELIGLKTKVVFSLARPYMGIEGIVVDETKNTFLIRSGNKERRVAKKNTIFEFILPNNESVRVNGNLLINLPENRLKRSIHKLK